VDDAARCEVGSSRRSEVSKRLRGGRDEAGELSGVRPRSCKATRKKPGLNKFVISFIDTGDVSPLRWKRLSDITSAGLWSRPTGLSVVRGALLSAWD
jgi:hypothetical protein